MIRNLRAPVYGALEPRVQTIERNVYRFSSRGYVLAYLFGGPVVFAVRTISRSDISGIGHAITSKPVENRPPACNERTTSFRPRTGACRTAHWRLLVYRSNTKRHASDTAPELLIVSSAVSRRAPSYPTAHWRFRPAAQANSQS